MGTGTSVGTGTEADALTAVNEQDSGKTENGEIEQPIQNDEPRRQWLVACQDVLENRNNVLNAARSALSRGQSVVIDRCNFDASQRLHWIQMAAQHRHGMQCGAEHGRGQQSILADLVDGEEPASTSTAVKFAASRGSSGRVLTVCVVLPRPDDVPFCAQRAISRGDNDGVHQPGTNWSVVCQRMRSGFVYPSMDEGFDAVYFCADAVALDRISAVLQETVGPEVSE